MFKITDSRQSVWIPPEFPITGRLPLEPRQVETNIKKQKKKLNIYLKLNRQVIIVLSEITKAIMIDFMVLLITGVNK
ncbi:hypothetical protein [Xenorhabdus szentirmaii]|uniref:Uncharacterized protein n=1 Tax=Xenorhabdus szentirmaii DSM 16338 TaxID=1427518 RepID=W1IUE2_9GAMM|nr:hypothetical protein [Xenorhabdus szentirmaii]PHM35228.1 hypothetical protein Xsze_01695 [Xenorhabdus szentirmaii DSM 16338]PHM44029.1 hypothetical protein Xszus_03853 [Xenorhabdus szentirmaii]CDL82112.1 hypothetical protein XSR1_190046 [Xenorhabdus szentirmaii DSM 16338]